MTGAGKTHTMQGTLEEPGVIPRAVESLITMANEKDFSNTNKKNKKTEVAQIEPRGILSPVMRPSGPAARGCDQEAESIRLSRT